MAITEMTQELWGELTRTGVYNLLGLSHWFNTDDYTSSIFPPPSKELWETLVERYKEEWGEDPHIKPERHNEEWIPFECAWIERVCELEFFSRFALKNGNEEKYKVIHAQETMLYKYGLENRLLHYR